MDLVLMCKWRGDGPEPVVMDALRMVEQQLPRLGEFVLLRILIRAHFTYFWNAMWFYYFYGNITL
jgi:hypothetical protein